MFHKNRKEWLQSNLLSVSVIVRVKPLLHQGVICPQAMNRHDDGSYNLAGYFQIMSSSMTCIVEME